MSEPFGVARDLHCHYCKRQKASNIQEVARGWCPRWYATRDPAAEEDCDEHVRVSLGVRVKIGDMIRAELQSPNRHLTGDETMHELGFDDLGATELILAIEFEYVIELEEYDVSDDLPSFIELTVQHLVNATTKAVRKRDGAVAKTPAPVHERFDAKVLEIESIRASGHVKRWHTLPSLGHDQSVAEHSGQAVSLLLLLHPHPSLDLLRAMLWHDTAERKAGDVPAPVRRENPEFAAMYETVEAKFTAEHHPTVAKALAALTDEDRRWLKAIDVLELVMHCHDLTMLGNQHAKIVMKRGVGYLQSSADTPKVVKNFLEFYLNQDSSMESGLRWKGPRSFA